MKLIKVCIVKWLLHEQKKEENDTVPDAVKFDIKIFESRDWKDRYLESGEHEVIKESNQHRIFVVKIKRIAGDPLAFLTLKHGFLLTYCSSILKGLPKWARILEENDQNLL